MSGLVDPDYYTIFVIGDVTPRDLRQEPSPACGLTPGSISLNLTNDWTGSGIDVFSVDTAAAGSLAILSSVVGSNAYASFPVTAAQLKVQSDTLATTTDFAFDFANAVAVPLLDGGVYDAISLSAGAAEPKLLLCNDEWITGASTACIGIAHD